MFDLKSFRTAPTESPYDQENVFWRVGIEPMIDRASVRLSDINHSVNSCANQYQGARTHSQGSQKEGVYSTMDHISGSRFFHVYFKETELPAYMEFPRILNITFFEVEEHLPDLRDAPSVQSLLFSSSFGINLTKSILAHLLRGLCRPSGKSRIRH